MPTARKASGPARRFVELPEAPCFRPTAEEWADPLRYIAAIRQQAEPYGLCRVVPPGDWAPPVAVEKEALQFRTLVQRVHELQERADDSSARESFISSFAAWQAATGALQKKAPSLGSQEVDLCSLYRAVSRRGGYAAVTEAKAWRDVARVLGVSCHCASAAWNGRYQCTACFDIMHVSLRGSLSEAPPSSSAVSEQILGARGWRPALQAKDHAGAANAAKHVYQKNLQQFEQHCAARDPRGAGPMQLDSVMLRSVCNQQSELGDAEAARVLGGMLEANAKRGAPAGPGAIGDDREPPNKRRRLQQARSSAVLTLIGTKSHALAVAC